MALRVQDAKLESEMRAINLQEFHSDTTQTPKCVLKMGAGMSVWNKAVLLEWIKYGLRNDCNGRVTFDMFYFGHFGFHPSKNQLKELIMSLPQMSAEMIDFHSIDFASIADTLELVHTVRSKVAYLHTFNGFRFKEDQVNSTLKTQAATVIVFDSVDFGPTVAKKIATDFAHWTIFFCYKRARYRLHAINAHVRRKSELLEFSLPHYNLTDLWPYLVNISI